MDVQHMEWPPRFQFASDVWPGLAKLAEECGEVVQVCGKIIGTAGTMKFADGSVVERDRLIEELADLRAVIDFVKDHALTRYERAVLFEREANKRALFETWRKNEIAAVEP